jgi:hypothetical protein
MSNKPGTVYDRIAELEQDVATLKKEMKIIKSVFRAKIARYEVSAIREGKEVSSIID